MHEGRRSSEFGRTLAACWKPDDFDALLKRHRFDIVYADSHFGMLLYVVKRMPV
ncbi:MAG: hypothetical protein Q8R39_04255 [bacterium]|nr:hypothetical protein [bacterium]MDZ4284987.1 hypothetical protein [Patescibacteria group bacterium]